MKLFGYDAERGVCCAKHDWRSAFTGFTAEALTQRFGGDRERAERVGKQLRDFRPEPVSSLVVDGSPLLAELSFWSYHLGLAWMAWSEPIEVVFGAAREPFRADAWPVFTVDLPSGGALLVVYRMDSLIGLGRGLEVERTYEGGVELWLAPADGGPGVDLAELSGHSRWPALRWAELREIARWGSADPLVVARRLLVLLPFVGDREGGGEAVAWVGRAVEVVSGRDRRSAQVRELAVSLVDQLSESRWSRVEGVWVGSGDHCERNPDREFAPHPWSREQLLRVDRALGG